MAFPDRVVRIPVDASIPAGLKTALILAETLLRNCVGFQPISCALRIACAAKICVGDPFAHLESPPPPLALARQRLILRLDWSGSLIQVN